MKQDLPPLQWYSKDGEQAGAVPPGHKVHTRLFGAGVAGFSPNKRNTHRAVQSVGARQYTQHLYSHIVTVTFRTDAGVHALHSTVQVDLERPNGQPYDTTILTGVLNRTLNKQRLPIRVLSSKLVANSFHCRYDAIGRTYLYRFAVAKVPTLGDCSLRNRSFETFIPVEEIDRCYFLQ